VLVACGSSGEPLPGNEPPTTLQIAPSSVELELDSATNVSVTNAEGEVFWSADDEAILDVVEDVYPHTNAAVRARSIGATTIRVWDEDGQQIGTAPATVFPDMLLSPERPEVQVTHSVQLTATGAAGPVTWSSDDESVASVSPSGLVSGLEPGATFIRASSGAQRALAPVTVACNLDPRGPWVRTEGELTFLRLPAGGPVPETVDTSFYAIKGEQRDLTIYFRNPGGGRGAEYISLSMNPMLGSVNGVRLEVGDSVLITVRIPDPYQVRLDVLPHDLYPEGGFDYIGGVRINYADADYPHVEPVGAYNRCLLAAFGEWAESDTPDVWARVEFADVGLDTGQLNGVMYRSGAIGVAYYPPQF
jgi:hypothetical protein